MPGSMLSTLHTLLHLIFNKHELYSFIIHNNRVLAIFNPYFADEETEVQEG